MLNDILLGECRDGVTGGVDPSPPPIHGEPVGKFWGLLYFAVGRPQGFYIFFAWGIVQEKKSLIPQATDR